MATIQRRVAIFRAELLQVGTLRKIWFSNKHLTLYLDLSHDLVLMSRIHKQGVSLSSKNKVPLLGMQLDEFLLVSIRLSNHNQLIASLFRIIGWLLE